MDKIKVNWDKKDFQNLTYVIKKPYRSKPFESYTHEEYKFMGNYVYQLPNIMPKFIDEILETFDYTVKAPALNKMTPGQILPLHIDEFEIFMEKYNISDTQQIERYIIFLEDSKPGHLMQINNTVHTNWRSGDFVKWTGETPHAAYNLGIEDRYTLQITCWS